MQYDIYSSRDCLTVFVEPTRPVKQWPDSVIAVIADDVDSTYPGFIWVPEVTNASGHSDLAFRNTGRKRGQPRKPAHKRRIIRCTEAEYAAIREYLAKLRE